MNQENSRRTAREARALRATRSTRTPITAPSMVTEYHWTRIIGALAALAILIAGGTLLFFGAPEGGDTAPKPGANELLLSDSSLDPASSEGQAAVPDSEIFAASSSQQVNATTPADSAKESAETASPEAIVTQTALVSSPTSGEPLPASDAAQVDAAAFASLANTDSTADDGREEFAADPGTAYADDRKELAVARILSQDPTAAGISASDRQRYTAAELADSSRVWTMQDNLLHTADDVAKMGPDLADELADIDRRILRARLSTGVKGYEPVDALSTDLVLPSEGIMRVFFFTELENLVNETVYHEWIRDGERVARIQIQPHRSPMRASSAKFIDRHMGGDWEVRVSTADGRRLGTFPFTVAVPAGLN